MHEFKLAIVNCCPISNKWAELESFFQLHNVDLLCETESHLNDSTLNSEAFSDDYCAHRKDRNLYGGSVFILVKITFPHLRLNVILLMNKYVCISITTLMATSYLDPTTAPTLISWNPTWIHYWLILYISQIQIICFSRVHCDAGPKWSWCSNSIISHQILFTE